MTWTATIYVASVFLSILIPICNTIKQKEEESIHISNRSSKVAVISTGYFFAFISIAAGAANSIVGVYETGGYHLEGSWPVGYFIEMSLLFLI